MRVALRRACARRLACFLPCCPERRSRLCRNDLKWLAASLGPARDWDVFLTETLPLIEAEFGVHGGLKDFIARCEVLRRAANARARRAVRSARYRRLNLRLAAWLSAESWLAQADPAARAALDEPIAGYASAVLARRYDRVRNKGRKLSALSPAALHRLRIAIKKFRYATDSFSGLYEEKSARDALKQLARLQDILGAMNDAATVADLMAHGFDGAAGRRMLEAKGILRGWSRRRVTTLKRSLMSAWKEFRLAERFW